MCFASVPYCHFLLFTHDYIRSWAASPRIDGVWVGTGASASLSPATLRGGLEVQWGGARHVRRPLGGLTFWRSVCSCFSITSSWYTLPVRSRGGSSLEGQGAGSGSWPTAGRSPGYRLPLVPEALGSPFLAGVPRDVWRRRPRSTWRGHVCGCGCGSGSTRPAVCALLQRMDHACAFGRNSPHV